ncbi:MAG: hypothetical protein E7520_05000 [Ruminococcaceae bacterium]|nr:hypothetical protein [Oscillospiraceae bacterium]
MADKEKKGFRPGAYAVCVGIVMAVVLVLLTIFAYTTRYTAFSPEKVAQSYVDGIVQTGDGYNSYKTTLVSKNGKLKYGDFIRKAYMIAYVNDGDDVKQADFVGKGNEEEQKAIDTVYSTMYDYYVELLKTYGWDDYDSMFTKYFDKLVEVRHAVYGDEYMSMEYMFGALEANVQTYADSLTGTEEVLAADNKTVLAEATQGAYQKMLGKDYKITCTVTDCKEYTADETKAYVEQYKARITPVAESGEGRADALGVTDVDEKNKNKTAMVDTFAALNHADEIESVAEVTVAVKDESGKIDLTQTVFVVKIGRSWYVDNTNISTRPLYLAQ